MITKTGFLYYLTSKIITIYYSISKTIEIENVMLLYSALWKFESPVCLLKYPLKKCKCKIAFIGKLSCLRQSDIENSDKISWEFNAA